MHERDKQAKKDLRKNLVRFLTRESERKKGIAIHVVKVAKITSVFIVILSIVTIVDCQFLPQNRIKDCIKSIEIARYEGSNEITVTLISKNRNWFTIKQASLGNANDEIAYFQTRFLKIISNDIVLTKGKSIIKRRYNARLIATINAIICILVVIIFSISKNLFLKESLGTYIILMFCFEVFLLLI